MEANQEESNGTDSKRLVEDKTQRDNINSYLEFYSNSEQSPSPQKYNESNIEQNDNGSPRKTMISPIELEKGQQEVESRVKEMSLDTDGDEYNFTEDQKRAMMELMTQNEEDSDLLDEEPPEYNVKGRLIQLNEELANDPTPLEVNREHKVGFKPKIVDLVASPSPDYSDDGQHSGSARQDTDSLVATSTSIQRINENGYSNKDANEGQENIVDQNQKEFVVEKDGQFFVVDVNDFRSTEKRISVDGNNNKKKVHKQNENQNTKGKMNSDNKHVNEERLGEFSSTSEYSSPKPPSEPRPKSGVSCTRRGLHSGQSSQSRSAGHSPQSRSIGQFNNSSSCLSDFTYSSPYAMTPEQKTVAREEARKTEKERKEIEMRQKQEEGERKRENNSAFNSWLDKKKEQEKQRQESEKQMEKPEKKEENEDAFKDWLRKKKTQMKQEKLLKRRQQQEQNDWFLLRTREECEKAYKEWLKKKNKDKKKQQQMDKQRYKLYRIQVKNSRKTFALIKALKEAQSFRYADYYGYRF